MAAKKTMARKTNVLADMVEIRQRLAAWLVENHPECRQAEAQWRLEHPKVLGVPADLAWHVGLAHTSRHGAVSESECPARPCKGEHVAVALAEIQDRELFESSTAKPVLVWIADVRRALAPLLAETVEVAPGQFEPISDVIEREFAAARERASYFREDLRRENRWKGPREVDQALALAFLTVVRADDSFRAALRAPAANVGGFGTLGRPKDDLRAAVGLHLHAGGFSSREVALLVEGEAAANRSEATTVVDRVRARRKRAAADDPRTLAGWSEVSEEKGKDPPD